MKWHISRNVSHAHLLTQWPNINTGEKRKKKENKIKTREREITSLDTNENEKETVMKRKKRRNEQMKQVGDVSALYKKKKPPQFAPHSKFKKYAKRTLLGKFTAAIKCDFHLI